MIAGYLDYLWPAEVAPEILAAGVRGFGSDAVVPRIRWHAGPSIERRSVGSAPTAAVEAPATCYATFLDEPGPGSPEHRTALLLEYLRDTTPAHGTAFVVFPLGMHDPRVTALVARAQATLGEAAVRCRRLYLSDLTQTVLDRLRAVAGQPPPPTTSTPPITTVASTALLGTDAAEPAVTPLIAAMQRNYTHAILRLGERIVARQSVFLAEDRADTIDRLLVQNKMSIRADVDADRLLAELAPGGELFGLLTRPLPPEPLAPSLDVLTSDAKVAAPR